MILPNKHRQLFSNPFGDLVDDSLINRNYILQKVSGVSCVVTVGDKTTEKILSYDIVPDLQIVDGLEKRQPRPVPYSPVDTISCSNPAGHITDEAVSAIIRAYESESPLCVRVDGEEDLLFIPALIYAPDDTMLMYGQPNRGMVLVQANPKTKSKAKQLLELFEG